jgi:15-cis-phytoene synthase
MTTSMRSYHWERQLLALALEAFDSHHAVETVGVDQPLLDQAYEQCQTITRLNSRTFYLASGLVPVEKRPAIRALYAFCRVSDDLVDRSVDDPRHELDAWRERALGPQPALDDPVALAWADTRSRYTIPRLYAEQLVDGVATDLEPARYETFEELSAYCYGVASTVGLMAMHIIGLEPGISAPQAIPFAVRLGVALQLTNILRDVGEDARRGRLYLPIEELHAFGLSAADVFEGRQDSRWLAFMHFQIERNRRLYTEAQPGITMLHRSGRFSIAAAAGLYRAILEDIEAHDGDVFTRRAYIGAWGKLSRLPGIWWSSRH